MKNRRYALGRLMSDARERGESANHPLTGSEWGLETA